MSQRQPDIVKDSYLHCIELLKKATHQIPILQQWSQSPHSITLSQLDTAPLAFVIAAIAHHLNLHKNKIILLIEDSHLLNSIHQELHTWHLPITLLQSSQTLTSTLANPDSLAQQEHDLQQWILNQSPDTASILLSSAESLFQNVLNPNSPHHFQYNLSENSSFEEDLFIQQLNSFEYERRPTVIQRGQFSQRGGIIDLFPWHGLHPLRLEVFDNTLESIRQLDLHQQTSIQKLNQITLDLRLHRDQDTYQPLHHFIQPQDWIISITPTKLLPEHPQYIHFNPPTSTPSLPIRNLKLNTSGTHFLLQSPAYRLLIEEKFNDWFSLQYQIHIAFVNPAEIERFKEIFANQPWLPKVHFFLALLYHSFIIETTTPILILSGAEILGRSSPHHRLQNTKLDTQPSIKKIRRHLAELQYNDLVVHIDHGIAQYKGTLQRKTQNTQEEVIELLFADQAKMFVPLKQAHLITRYLGLSAKKPPLSKLADPAWKRTRKKIDTSIEQYAANMLKLAADRQSSQGFNHLPDNAWQHAFESSFLYRETPDQLTSIADIKKDMETQRPMDRLLCADVGFGKTEVALRAAFKAVMSGKQVAILVPTTILARQHYNLIQERMADFPIRTAALSRLTPAKQEKLILQDIQNASLDIVVGTHRLISKDVHFPNLGLVIIDEEQRFGVKHKERFKQLFNQIDILTLSATPIPRTLYQALIGTRDMSTIETPPAQKQTVQTIVSPYDPKLIQQAIQFELSRQGQIFYLHNRIADIQQVASQLQTLAPSARILIGHGQMDPHQLEDVMHQFVEGQADILVCTTIIESGVDIPNANTIIIDRADHFGLADLYQLRGRVGRAGSTSYAYLLIPKDLTLSSDAAKRVSAIKQYTELGSGFKIAMRDLEIRGAGNLLGTEQSGHIATIGYELYCHLLKKTVQRLSGQNTATHSDILFYSENIINDESRYHQLKQENPKANLAPSFIPTQYIPESIDRIHAYRQIADTYNLKQLQELREQWIDQFGKRLPKSIENLLTITQIKMRAAQRHIAQIEIKEQRALMQYQSQNNKKQYYTKNGQIPTLKEKKPHLQLQELLTLF